MAVASLPEYSPDPVERASAYPMLRYMGSKARLLPWLHEVFAGLDFTTVLDPFSGSGVVAYLLKAMGKEVTASDFLLFPSVIARATIENDSQYLERRDVQRLMRPTAQRQRFIEDTFSGIFYTPDDLAFLDTVSDNIRRMRNPYKRAVALAALIRSCAKRQPRGVFSFAGGDRYNDGRRDLRLTLAQHFVEQVDVYNAAVLDTGVPCHSIRADVLEDHFRPVDLVYLDPPYVPRSDDNCYIKRYHFLEGLASYWTEAEPVMTTRVRKIPKRYTPFSYRSSAVGAFDALFKRFKDSTVVLSYSSNGYPDLEVLTDLLLRYKSRVAVHQRNHTYHFGTHSNVSKDRTEVREFLIVGTE